MTQEERILTTLAEFGWTATSTLINLGIYQYNARIKGLREKGFDIVAEKGGKDQHGFTLRTPKSRIDWTNLTVKPEPAEQTSLFDKHARDGV